MLVNDIRFYFKFHCYVDLFGFLFGGFMHLFQEVGSEVNGAWKAYKELWVLIWILGFSSFYLEIFMFFGCFLDFGCFYLLFYFKNFHGLCKNHIYYGMMNLSIMV
jgi:hypothetical protein